MKLESAYGKFVGIVAPRSFYKIEHIKQLLLMFEIIVLDVGSRNMTKAESMVIEGARKEIDWLSEEGLLTTMGGLISSVRSKELPMVEVHGNVFITSGVGSDADLLGRAAGLVHMSVGGLRHTASDLRSKYGIDAIAAPTGMESINADAPATRESVVRITLGEFPLPSASTPWEAMKSFRDDDKARSQFARLKNWINEMGKSGLKNYELSDHLREMIFEYEETMKLHKMKIGAGMLEIFVVTTAEVAENVVRLKLSDAMKAIFAARRHQIDLLEEEKNAPGREIAYVVSANQSF